MKQARNYNASRNSVQRINYFTLPQWGTGTHLCAGVGTGTQGTPRSSQTWMCLGEASSQQTHMGQGGAEEEGHLLGQRSQQ